MRWVGAALLVLFCGCGNPNQDLYNAAVKAEKALYTIRHPLSEDCYRKVRAYNRAARAYNQATHTKKFLPSQCD